MKNTVIILFTLLQFQGSKLEDQDALFIDELLGHNKEVIMMAEITLNRGHRLDLRKEARKIIRNYRTENRQLESWRMSYFSEVPDFWIEPSIHLRGIRALKDEDFDAQAVLLFVSLYEEFKPRLSEMEQKTIKSFLVTLTQNKMKNLKRYLQHFKSMKQREVI